MGKHQREKGKRGEREVAHLFRKAGYCAERTRQSDGSVDPDVRVRDREGGLEVPIWVEVKRRTKVGVHRFVEQAQEEAKPSGAAPVVFYREDGCTDWSVVLDAETFLKLLSKHPIYRPDY